MTAIKQQTKQVNMRLSRDTVSEIEDIKTYHNLETTTDTIRYLIRQEARRINVLQDPLRLWTQELTTCPD